MNRSFFRSVGVNVGTLVMCYVFVGALVAVFGIVLVASDAADTAGGGPARRAHAQAQSDVINHKAILDADYPPCARRFGSDDAIIACMKAREDDSTP